MLKIQFTVSSDLLVVAGMIRKRNAIGYPTTVFEDDTVDVQIRGHLHSSRNLRHAPAKLKQDAESFLKP